MLRFLIAVDGSEASSRMIDHLLKKNAWYKEPIEVHLLNVQHPLHGDVTTFVDKGQIQHYHHDEGIKALAAARAKLDAAGVRYVFHIGVGEPAQMIDHYAREKKCDQIVMGSRGLGSMTSLVLGSVTTKVMHLTDLPVLIVK
ncbi:MAG: universal stress protein [Rhodocyclales bacterium]|nr:universal stress protein [Rhodocyclales bacterium]